ncbi:MAG: YqaA family protein [Promethearchaeota archaeon]
MVDFKLGKKIRIRNLEIFTFIVLAIIYTLALVIEPGTVIYTWVATLSASWRGLGDTTSNVLWIAFLITMGGNSTVLIVVPYAVVIADLSIKNPSMWLSIALVSGIGATIGEIVSYYVGRLIGGSKKVKESELGEKFHRMKQQFEKHPRTVPITVFLFALTPLPDDMLLVPLGMMNYNYKKTIIPCMIGKTMLTSLICFIGAVIGDNLGSDSVNPSVDLFIFSFVFIFIYFVARVDLDRFVAWANKDRKKFQTLLIEGGNKSLSALIEEYGVINQEKFTLFIPELVAKYPNMSQQENLFHFDKVVNKKEAYRQSMDFISFFFADSSGEAETEIAEVKIH